MSIRIVKLGIVSESRDNILICRWLCRNILKGSNFGIRSVKRKSFDNNTKITPESLPAILDFYERKKKNNALIDCVIILTDLDNSDSGYKEFIEEKLRSMNFPYPFIVAVPKNTIENWLILDIKTLNNVLGLHINKIPPKDVSAKHYLDSFIGQSSKDSILARVEIAKSLDIDFLGRHCDEFLEFKKEIQREICPAYQRPIRSVIKKLARINGVLIKKFQKDPTKIVRR